MPNFATLPDHYGRQTELALDHSTLEGAYRLASQEQFPFLEIPASVHQASVEEWDRYAKSIHLSDFSKTHYERFKITASMFRSYIEPGDRLLEFGSANQFTDFLSLVTRAEIDSFDQISKADDEKKPTEYDCVLCLDFLGHLNDKENVLNRFGVAENFNFSGIMYVFEQAYRLLKPNGLFLVSTPNATSVDAIAQILAGRHPHLFDPHIRELAPVQVRAFAQLSGFDLEAFGTFFAWETATPDLRERLLAIVAELGFDPSNRGDEACYVFRKVGRTLLQPSADLRPGIDDFELMVGRSASYTAEYWRDRHQNGQIPDYEDVLQKVYEKFITEDSVVVDVGVNVGRHFNVFHNILGPHGRLIGFEPVPDFATQAQSGTFENVEIRELAVSDRAGVGEFLFMTKAIGESGFKERTSEGDRGAERIQVSISTLDNELAALDRLTYIKIDTEGHELSVLKGARETLARLRPIVSVEWGEPTYALYGHTKFGLYDLANELGYIITDLFGNLVMDRAEWESVSDRSYWDYFLVPAERTAAWSDMFQSGSGA